MRHAAADIEDPAGQYGGCPTFTVFKGRKVWCQHGMDHTARRR